MTRYAVRLQNQIDVLKCASFGVKNKNKIEEIEKALDNIEELLGPDSPVEENVNSIRETVDSVNTKSETEFIRQEVCEMVRTLGLHDLSEEWKYDE